MGQGQLIDETGNQYGRWTVIARAENDKQGAARWLCRCQCGKEKLVQGYSLRRGASQSCCCLQHESIKLPKGEAAFNHLFRRLKRTAKARGREWALTKEEVRVLTSQPCHYCGVEPRQGKSNRGYYGKYIYNGLDRVNSSLGYIFKNVVPCCGTCNKAKNAMSLEEFESWIYRVYKHLTNLGRQGS